MQSRLRRALLVTALLSASSLASLQSSAQAGHVTTPVVGDVTMGNLAANERELHIVVDPNDPDHLAGGANERGGGNTQEWYTSTDGGRTWTSGNLPLGTLTVADNSPASTSLMSDPALDFGAGGRIYYSALAHGGSEDPCTLFVTATDDDGANWTDPASGIVADGGTSICHDKEFILVDRANSENVYVAWTPFGGGNNREVVFARDLGGAGNGFAFGGPVVLSTDSAQDGCLNHGAELAQEADGDLYVVWSTYCNGLGDGADSSIWVARSTDLGQTFGAPVQVATMDNVSPAIASGFRTRSFAAIDIDQTSGRAFVVYADYVDSDGGDADILISSAIDNAGWTAPSNVDGEPEADAQFMPWVDVANGRVHVVFYEFDDESFRHNVFLTHGPIAASPAFTRVQVNSLPTPAATGFLGDYISVDVGSDDVAHPSWGDGRTGTGGLTDGWTARVNFSPPSTVSAAAVPDALPWDGSTTVTAAVMGAHGEAERFIPVAFTVASSGTPSLASGSSTTNAAGKATFSYSNGSAGSDLVTAWADLDEDGTQESGETTTITVEWQKHPAIATYTGPTSGDHHDPLTMSGTLRDGLTNAPIAGQTIALGFGTETCSATTDAAGAAECTLTPQQIPGAYVAQATFGGNGQHDAATSAGVPFTLKKEQTTLSFSGPAFAANGDPVTLSANLTEDDPTPVQGRNVLLTFGSGGSAQTCFGSTDAAGMASCTISALLQPNGPATVTAEFAGDSYYLPSSDSGQIVVFTWTPGGNFVIGDGNAATGTTATFWHSEWSLRNTVSGGSGPAKFKGFANSPADMTACGGTWKSDPGNSAPSAAQVPDHTAVLVTDKVTKSGSAIGGTKPRIAVVRVDPGYAPNPGHPGTAEVLGLYC